MNVEELARAVAADMEPDVQAATDREIRHEPHPDAATRSFGVSEAIAVAQFVLASAAVVVEVLRKRRDRALLQKDLAEGFEADPRLLSYLDPERRLGVLARVVDKLIPEQIGSSPSLLIDKPRTKSEWVADWLGVDDSNGTRAMTSPVLMPFADMDNFIVYTPIHWTPPSGAPASLPKVVTVPKGFVTDLATIPAYFWWAVRPTGRHGHAAILHDWLYWEQGVTRSVADLVFETALADIKVDAPLRKAMWAAVRIGGGRYWTESTQERRSGGSRILKRFPDEPVAWCDWRRQPDIFA